MDDGEKPEGPSLTHRMVTALVTAGIGPDETTFVTLLSLGASGCFRHGLTRDEIVGLIGVVEHTFLSEGKEGKPDGQSNT